MHQESAHLASALNPRLSRLRRLLPASQHAVAGPIHAFMRYAKLSVGVLLAFAGLGVTMGAIGGWIYYVSNCVGAPGGSLAADVCAHPSALNESVLWTVGAIVLDASAVLAVRSRTR